MDPAQVAAFNARAGALRAQLYPGTIIFAGSKKEWAVAFGAAKNSRQIADSGQGFFYFKEAVVHFPVDPDFTPTLASVFTRQADAMCPKATKWKIETLDTVPQETYLKLTVARTD